MTRFSARAAKVVVLALVVGGSAVSLGGAASKFNPHYRVDFRFTSVSKSMPPNIVEIRRAGKGRLQFAKSPFEGEYAHATTATGKIVLHYDVLTPHPRTEQLTLRVDEGLYEAVSGNEFVKLDVEVTESTTDSCPDGIVGTVRLDRRAPKKQVVFQIKLDHPCQISEIQTAAIARNARLHVDIDGTCLNQRTTAARGKPLCPSSSAAGTTWKIVKTPCPPPRAQVGPACWEGNLGDKGEFGNWTVGLNNASWVLSWGTHRYSYQLPQEITPTAGADAFLGVSVDILIDAGSSAAIGYASMPFRLTGGSGGVSASVPGKGQASASGRYKLFSKPAPTGTKVQVVIGIQDGGRLTYTYVAKT